MILNETLIERYFSKQLSIPELQEIEIKYHTDEYFKAEVDFLKDIQYVSELDDDSQFKSQLASYETEFSETQEPKSPSRSKRMIAVGALLLIIVGITFFLNKTPNNDQLFSNYFEPSKNVSAPIVRSESNDKLLSNAFIAYSEADYQKTIPLLEKAFESTKNSELLFYKGNALLALNQTKDAIEVFKKHQSFSDALTNRSHWYLALAYLKTDQVENAKQELKGLIDSGEPFKKKEANSLLKKLN